MKTPRPIKAASPANETPANEIDAYAMAVVRGDLPAGKYHRLSCQRHLNDRQRENTPEFPYRFDLARARKKIRFFGLCKHYKGKQFRGKPIILEPWQQFAIGSVFGWIHVTTRRRRFETAFLMIPRKNGKSIIAAVLAILVTFFDGEAAGEGYVVANKRDQARIVFGDSQALVRNNPSLSARLKVNLSAIWSPATSSKLIPLGKDSDTTDGLNWNLCVIDEFHAMIYRALLDVLESAVGAREQQLMCQITTAGIDPLGPCGEQYDYVCKILEGVFPDETVFGFITHADEGDDPFDERTWFKANPNLNISIDIEKLRTLARKAQQMPSALAEFKQKRLNLWVNSATPWLNLTTWKAGQSKWAPARLKGRRCWGGLDLSSKIDLSAFVLVFPPEGRDPKWRMLCWFWTPLEGIAEREKRARAPYRQWVKQKHLLTNPGARIDHGTIKAAIVAAAGRYDIQQIGFDPWNIGNLDHDLKEALAWDDQRVIEIGQNFNQLTEPCKEFEALVADGLIDAAGHPIMLWMASNAVVVRDGNDNMKPTKDPKKTRGRIDGIVAGIMGLKLAQMEGGIQQAEGCGLTLL